MILQMEICCSRRGRAGRHPWVLPRPLAAACDSADGLDLSSSPADLQLVELLWAGSPDRVAARAKLGQAEAEVTRPEVFQNPGFDF
jgi:hypothetical protein